MTWRNYKVWAVSYDGKSLTFTVRGISVRDVEYVCRHACKRNNGRAILAVTDTLTNISPED